MPDTSEATRHEQPAAVASPDANPPRAGARVLEIGEWYSDVIGPNANGELVGWSTGWSEDRGPFSRALIPCQDRSRAGTRRAGLHWASPECPPAWSIASQTGATAARPAEPGSGA